MRPLWHLKRDLENDRIPVPTLVYAERDLAHHILDSIEPIRFERDARMFQRVRQVQALYQLWPDDEWKKTWVRKEEPIRALIPTSRFTSVLQTVAADWADALRELGHEARVMIEETPYERLSWHTQVREIVEYQPTLWMQVDHHRGELGYGKVPWQLPAISWLMDRLPPLYERDLPQALRERDWLFAFWPRFAEELMDLGYRNVRVLGPSANTNIYFPRLGKLDDPPDVAIVSNALSGAGDVRMAQKLAMARAVVRSGRSLGLWGAGWAEIADLGRYARGYIADRDEVARVYSSVKIVLSGNFDTNALPRPLEVAACGGFCLPLAHRTDDHAGGLHDYLRRGSEIVTVPHILDLPDAIRSWCAADSARRWISTHARARVLRDHTHVIRMRWLLDLIAREFGKMLAPPRKIC